MMNCLIPSWVCLNLSFWALICFYLHLMNQWNATFATVTQEKRNKIDTQFWIIGAESPFSLIIVQSGFCPRKVSRRQDACSPVWPNWSRKARAESPFSPRTASECKKSSISRYDSDNDVKGCCTISSFAKSFRGFICILWGGPIYSFDSSHMRWRKQRTNQKGRKNEVSDYFQGWERLSVTCSVGEQGRRQKLGLEMSSHSWRPAKTPWRFLSA